ncbi:hypothetical protein [Pectinatus frisingensis]|uniref:hypothetical protein n=1 Tax=Pectinatus frisingensis TaxID=865 RepID=UPI0018C4EFE6|nr:hypothetical protein [Pectinatus frisingensis]
MELMKRTEYLQEDYIGRKIAANLAIDYDENQLLVEEFLDRTHGDRKECEIDVK